MRGRPDFLYLTVELQHGWRHSVRRMWRGDKHLFITECGMDLAWSDVLFYDADKATNCFECLAAK